MMFLNKRGEKLMENKLKKELKQILIALGVFLLFTIFDKANLFPFIFENRLYSFLAYVIPYALSGWNVVRKALLGIKNRQPFDESFLMFVATIGAFATGENSEACAVMLFYQVGEWFQSYAVGKSRASITQLMDIVPEHANLEKEDGTIEIIDPDDVEIGNILVIKPGEKIPVDGIVKSGESLVNTAALTGESVPRTVRAGDEVISGCINGEGLLKIEATKAFEDSTVSKILELVENASEKKSQTENFITRFARWYTPVVVYSALALAIIPSIITRNPMTWIYRACTFLVISCPCALVISIPLSFFGGIGAASRNGVLVKGSNYLELMAELDTVVSDKTGTLTKGTFKVTDVITKDGITKEEVLREASLAEGLSTHPIAKSIYAAFRDETKEEINTSIVTDTENVTGSGIIATIDNHKIYVGNQKLMEANNIPYIKVNDQSATVSYVAKDNEYLGAILIKDEVKPEAKNAIKQMKQENVNNVVMLTGDRKEVGEAVGKELGLDTVYTDLLPQDKVSKVEELLEKLKHKGNKNKRPRLAFIGDGINDAPVLSRADVGVAMGSLGSDAAIEAADVVIMDDDLMKIPTTIKIAKKTVSIATQNIIFALFVKFLILILGAIGKANMWAAVFADVGVAVICILNAMHLLKYNGK